MGPSLTRTVTELPRTRTLTFGGVRSTLSVEGTESTTWPSESVASTWIVCTPFGTSAGVSTVSLPVMFSATSRSSTSTLYVIWPAPASGVSHCRGMCVALTQPAGVSITNSPGGARTATAAICVFAPLPCRKPTSASP